MMMNAQVKFEKNWGHNNGSGIYNKSYQVYQCKYSEKEAKLNNINSNDEIKKNPLKSVFSLVCSASTLPHYLFFHIITLF